MSRTLMIGNTVRFSLFGRPSVVTIDTPVLRDAMQDLFANGLAEIVGGAIDARALRLIPRYAIPAMALSLTAGIGAEWYASERDCYDNRY